MCTYARTIFSCSHVYWGRRLKTCTIAEDFQQGLLSEDCALRKPHGLKSTRLARRCDKCVRLDERLSVARRTLEDSRGVFEKKWSGAADVGKGEQGDGSPEKHEHYGDSVTKKHEEHKDGSAEREGGAQVTDRKDEAEAESGWIYSENSEIKTRRVEEPKDNRAFPEEQPEDDRKAFPTEEREPQGAEESRLRTHAGSNNIGGLDVSASPPSDAGSSAAAEDREYLVTGDATPVPETGLSIPDSPLNDEIKAATFPTESPVQQRGSARASPRTTPRSRLALPIPRARKTETTASPSSRAQITAADQVKQPETREKATPKAVLKSRLAVPASKPPPRQFKATGAQSRLPKPGSFTSKLVQPSSRALG
jgi:hypothetical protein